MSTSNDTSRGQKRSEACLNNDTQVTTGIRYQFDFERYFEHLVDVSLTFTAATDSPQLWLPAWIPGSYLMREFARNITAVHYQILDSQTMSSEAQPETHRAEKIDKHTWQLPQVKAGQAIEVCYEVYCYDLSVRTAYVDQQRLYGNFTSLALAIDGHEHQPIQVKLIVPAAFLADKDEERVCLATGLDSIDLRLDGQYCLALQVDNYHDLIDYPFEFAEQDKFDFIVQDDKHQTLSHRFYISGKHSADMGRLQQDVTQICQTYVDWLGDAPFADYTFMTFASGNDYGGLEHINSTSLITPRRDLPSIDEPAVPNSNYQRFLGLCSHEYFHAWWVKTVRPDVMLDVDLRREAFTPLLWVFEGFTSYIDDFMLQASGVIDKPSYLELLAEQINRYHQTPGRAYQSVAESSFDAWIKLYRSDENTGNAGISYYNKGALVALCLDLILLEKTNGRYRLFDVVKAFYQQAKANSNKRIGITSADVGDVIGQFMPLAKWQDFERRYVNGVEALPIEALLTANGIKLRTNTKETADKHVPWGMRCTDTPAGLTVNRVMRDSAAARAGISANDIIIAIGGIKADTKQLAQFIKAEHDIECFLFRRDELMRVTVLPKVAIDETDDSTDVESSDIKTAAPHKISLHLAKKEPLSQTGNESSKEEASWQTWLNVMQRG
ncbi:MAG: M61 family metallopeptidase [Psychrobacter sp.]|uniref:M61 family metallopeptidase n=3 Tax=Psychrobacter sp. TaxID=56811 RepID=UPI003F9E7092